MNLENPDRNWDCGFGVEDWGIKVSPSPK